MKQPKPLKRLRKICAEFYWHMEVVAGFEHPVNRVPNALMFRYDSSPQVKFEAMADGRYRLVQDYHGVGGIVPCRHFGLQSGSILTYNELCHVFKQAVKMEKFDKLRHGWPHDNYQPVPQDWIVSR